MVKKSKKIKKNKKEVSFTYFIIIAIVVLLLLVIVIDVFSSNADVLGKARDAYMGARNPERYSNSSSEKLSITNTRIQQEVRAIKNRKLDYGIIDLIKTARDNMQQTAFCEEAEEAIGYKYNFQPDLEQIEYVYCTDIDGNNGEHPFKQSTGVFYYSMYDVTPDYSVYPLPDIPTEYNIFTNGCHKIQDKCKTEDEPFLYEAECDPVKEVPTFRVVNCEDKFGENYVCQEGACILDVLEIVEECGNGLTEPGEECDDGNLNNGDSCNEYCEIEEWCGDAIIQEYLEEECDDGNQENDDGCSEDCEIEMPPPDLTIGYVNPNAVSEYCVNFYVFEVCNVGESTVEEEIEISIQANGEVSVFEYEPMDGLDPFECELIKNPPKTHIFKFTTLDSMDNVLFMVDPDDEIDESDETNNFMTQIIYSGDNYYYEPNNFEESNVCSTWCYDSDDGKNWWQAGTTSYLYNQEMGSKTDVCDKYYGYQNQAILTEYYCLSPIYKLDNGLFPYPALQKELDCTVLDAKCENGACIPIDNNQLSCQDLEGGANAWTYGEVLYTSIDGEDSVLQDVCVQNNEKVLEYYCEDDQLANAYWHNCVYDNALCVDGECVEVDEQNICQDNEPENDPFSYGTLEFHKFTGETDYYDDDCSFDRHEVEQDYCVNVNEEPKEMDYDCTQDIGIFGAALCVDGACVYPDPNLMACDEIWDDGLDYYNKGHVESVSMHGVQDQNTDACLPGGNLLIEYFCVGEELHMAEPYDCGLEGMTCYNGKCTTPDENLKFCEEVTDEDGITQVQYINEFGLSTWLETACIDDDENIDNLDLYNYDEDSESNTLVTFSCNGNDAEYQITDCTEMDGVCYKGECLIPDFDLVSCESPIEGGDGNDPFVDGFTDAINEFGVEKTKYDECEDEYELQEYYCDGNEYEDMYIDCNTFGMKCYDDICQTPNPDLMECVEIIYSNGDNSVSYTNDFGEEDYYNDKCINPEYAEFIEAGEPNNVAVPTYNIYNEAAQYQLHYTCNEDSSLGKTVIDCEEQGQVCYNGLCVTSDPTLMNCDDQTSEDKEWFETDPQDPFLEGFSKETNEYGQETGYWDYCQNEETVNEMYCDGNVIENVELDCVQYNMMCNPWSGSCEIYDESLKECFKSDDGNPNVPGYGYIIDGFGNMEDGFDKCKGSDKVREGFCNDVEPYEEIIDCDQGLECRKFCDENNEHVGSACTDPDNEDNVCEPIEVIGEEEVEVIEEEPSEP
jgi:cysteine-rich repeat protein